MFFRLIVKIISTFAPSLGVPCFLKTQKRAEIIPILELKVKRYK